MREKEEILFSFWDDDWDDYMPVTLLTYSSGGVDLHCQTGKFHEYAINVARSLLKQRGLEVCKLEFIGGTGAYYPVKKIK